MNRLTFRRKSTEQSYTFTDGVWLGPGDQRVVLTRLQERIALRFLNSPRARLSAEEVQAEISDTSNANDRTGYRKHINKINVLFESGFGFGLLASHLNSGVRSGGAKSRQAEYSLSEDIEVIGDIASETTLASSIAIYREALERRSEWFKIRPILSSGEDIDVKSLYVELFLRPWDSSIQNVSRLGVLSEHEAPRSAAAVHRVTAESLIARAAGRTVVVGGPGAGKTTLLKWIGAYLLKQQSGEMLTPIPVALRDFARSLQAGLVTSLLEYALIIAFGQSAAADHLEMFQRSGEKFRAIYLLDGWDEVSAEMRTDVLRAIESAATDHPLLLTTRINAASFLNLNARTEMYELGALADEAVAELCDRQGRIRGRSSLVPGLLNLIENGPRLWSLAGNPYLLTLLCEVIFASSELPVAEVVSPIWVLSHAIDLIRSDYNAGNPADPLTVRSLDRITELAYSLSFGRSKRTNFEPESDLGDSTGQFSDSPIGRSRFFNATNIGRTSFAFVHLRLQEFLAARWASGHEAIGRAWLDRYLLSRTWREEAQFVAAILIKTESRDRGFRMALRALVQSPDRAGESIRCVAAVLAAAGVRDGGNVALGIDVRAVLWQRIHRDAPFLTEDSQALLELDPEYLVRKAMSIETPDDTLLMNLYRFLPLRLRKEEMDPHLAASPVLSWLIGLPGRGFPSIEDLDAIGSQALDERLSEEKRVHALRDLGSARSVSQVHRIVPLLQDSSEELATAAAETLGKIGGRGAAVALAEAILLVDEQTVREAPGYVAALLNALSITGYGAIEPHSRDVLVDYINSAPDKCDNLELILDAIAGTPLPEPPKRIQEILSEQDASQVSLRKAAASVLRGVTEPRILNRAIDQLQTEPNQQVREAILGSISFVPIGFHDFGCLWKLCRSRSTKEASLALLLVFRTVTRYPQHPLVPELNQFVDSKIGELATAKNYGALHQHVLNGIRSMRPEERVKRTLLSILNNPSLGPETLALVSEALAVQRLTLVEQRSLRHHLKSALALGNVGARLSSALAVTLFAHRPDSAPYLFRLLQRHGKAVGDHPAETLLKAVHMSGYLIYEDRMVYPDGVARTA